MGSWKIGRRSPWRARRRRGVRHRGVFESAYVRPIWLINGAAMWRPSPVRYARRSVRSRLRRWRAVTAEDTDIDLTVSRASKDVVSALVNNRPVSRDVAKAPDLTALVNKYTALSAPLANRVVGSAAAPLTRTSNAAGESSLGDIIADAQLDATSPAALGGAVVAFMNPGGIRADLPSGSATYGQLFTVQPFSNVLTVVTCTGAQIDALLEQQFRAAGNVILQVSKGFTYTWDNAAAIGSRVDIASIKIGGVPVSALQSYRVTTNNFLVTGGDGFSVFTGCTNPLGGDIDLDAFVRYFELNSPVVPGPQNRITRVG